MDTSSQTYLVKSIFVTSLFIRAEIVITFVYFSIRKKKMLIENVLHSEEAESPQLISSRNVIPESTSTSNNILDRSEIRSIVTLQNIQPKIYSSAPRNN